MKWLSFAIGLATLTSGLSAAAQPTDRPNVLFIAIDDLNDWTGYLGEHPDAKTPNLDRLAARSVIFTHAYAAAPKCHPSRVAVLTGLRPSTTGIYENNFEWESSAAARDAVLLPEHFHDHGYHTIWAGKIFHRKPSEERLAAMWDDMENADGGYGPNTKEVHVPREATIFRAFDYEPWDGPDADFADVRNADKVIDALQSQYEQPFFIALGLYRPHNPWTAPRRYFEAFDPEAIALPAVIPGDLEDVPPIGRSFSSAENSHDVVERTGHWRPLVHAYLACTNFMDDQLGRVIDALDASPHADNTIVVVWSDHGFHLGQKEHWAKSALWEVTTRVPLLVDVPGSRHRGRRVDATVSLLDLYPTLLDLIDIPAPSTPLEGQSLRPLLEQPDTAWNVPAVTTYGWRNHAVRLGRWRYIRYHDGTEELYDHRRDPHEWHNLSSNTRYESVKFNLEQLLPSFDAPPTVPPDS